MNGLFSSVGGGALAEEGTTKAQLRKSYDMNRMVEILYWCDVPGAITGKYVQQCGRRRHLGLSGRSGVENHEKYISVV